MSGPSAHEKLVRLLAAVCVIALLLVPSWRWARERMGALWSRMDAVTQVRVRPPSPSLAEPVRVEVLNGCGAPQIAAQLTRKIRRLGLDVIDQGNAESFHYLESMVIDRRGDMEKARWVARLVGIPVCIQQISHDPSMLADVSIIIGRDHRRLALLVP